MFKSLEQVIGRINKHRRVKIHMFITFENIVLKVVTDVVEEVSPNGWFSF